MVFWIFVEKNKKTVFEANGRYKQKKKTQTKKRTKSQKPSKKSGPIRRKVVFCQPCSYSIDNVEQKIQDNNNEGITRLIFAGKQDNSV
jgi:hypothetical protein